MKTSCNLPIGGFHKQSMIDYPGHISSIVFTCGCNFKCSYCHNYQLIDSHLSKDTLQLDEDELFGWFEKNKILLDAVVITGGEPTLHDGLSEFIRKIKALGLKVKLDTNGTNPRMLNKLIKEELLDYIAMDIKAPLVLENYRKVVGKQFTESHLEKVKESVYLLNETNIDSEFRTTFDESLSIEDLRNIIGIIRRKYFIQNRLREGRRVGKRIEENDLKQLLSFRLTEYCIQVRN